MGRLVCALVLLVAAPVHAQEALSIETGFTPDPAHLTGHTGGREALTSRAPSCRGFVGHDPNHVLQLGSDFGFLRMFVVAGPRLTLAVRGPDGGWRCATARQHHPALQDGRYPAGRYEIFVGSGEPGLVVEYELSVTEFRTVGPRQGLGRSNRAMDVGLEPEEWPGWRDWSGERRREVCGGRDEVDCIRRGFLPDPMETEAQAGGPIDLRLLGAECQGHVSAAAGHLLLLRNDFDYFRVQLGDTIGSASLVVRTPGGRYLCSAPTETNAFIDEDVWPAGVYHIWVGSREPEATPTYHLCYTEIRPAEGSIMCGHDRSGHGTAAAHAREQRER